MRNGGAHEEQLQTKTESMAVSSDQFVFHGRQRSYMPVMHDLCLGSISEMSTLKNNQENES
jgi:hypothetical protein